MTVQEQVVLTPTVRGTARRWLYWAIFAVVAVLIAIVALLGSGANRPLGIPLDPSSPGPQGAKAVVEVLREQGVTVTMTDSLEATREAIGSDATTVVLHDRDGLLDADTARDAGQLGDHLVLLHPEYLHLEAIAPDVALAGIVEGDLDADCEVDAVERAGTVTGDGWGYRYLGDDPAVTECLDSGDNVVSLVQFRDSDRVTTIVGTTDAFSNDRIAEQGNAALALGILGEHADLIWYTPGLGDLADDSAAQLTPPWVTQVIVLLLLVVLAAGIWRGRRLGPLVVENLPVTVRSTETMEGRARLYQRSSSRLRALDSLRVGTVQRLAARVRLGRSSGVDQVAAMVASITGMPLSAVRGLLVETIPHTDRELIELSDRLLELEHAVTAATTP